MKRSSKIAVAVVVSLGLSAAVAAAFAHPGGTGPGMMRGMGPDGIRTVTESGDPQVAIAAT